LTDIGGYCRITAHFFLHSSFFILHCHGPPAGQWRLATRHTRRKSPRPIWKHLETAFCRSADQVGRVAPRAPRLPTDVFGFNSIVNQPCHPSHPCQAEVRSSRIHQFNDSTIERFNFSFSSFFIFHSSLSCPTRPPDPRRLATRHRSHVTF